MDVAVDGARDELAGAAGLVLAGAAGLVLADDRGPLAVMTHAGHQVPEPGAAVGGELAPGMAKVVEMQAVSPIDSTACGRADILLKLPSPQRSHADERPSDAR